MGDLVSMMRFDSKQLIEGNPDLSPLLGTWVNANAETDCVVKLTVVKRNGRVIVQAYGAQFPEPVDWGEAEASAFVSGGISEGIAFQVHYLFNGIETTLAANHKQGILTIQSYTTFKDGSGRMNYFAREFFHQ
jgi:hypothetical protein